MNKRQNLSVIFLMSIALVGIICIQVYWVKTSIDDKEEVFSQSVTQILKKVGAAVEQREMREYIGRFVALLDKDSLANLKESQIREFVFVQENKDTKETLIYTHGILEEDYKLPSSVFENTKNISDSTQIKNLLSRQNYIRQKTDIEGKKKIPIASYEQIKRLNALDKIAYEETFKKIADKQPISTRISRPQIDFMIQQELDDRELKMNFEYAIYNNGKLTKVHTNNFKSGEYKEYKVSIFDTESEDTSYELVVVFPDRNKYLLSSTIGIAILSLLFTCIIIVTFLRTIMQLYKQKQISEIKTDFINNMTHEFKTPIATINLALDAMKNPMVADSKERLQTYLKMIRDENKRMHAQVENVLRISKLDRKQLYIEKEPLDVHELIEDAIMHIQLLVEEKNGIVKKHLNAIKTEILANDLHFTNILVNILENAIKYSPNAPEIDIYTENVNNQILIKVQDKGSGMSKAVLKKVFEKFYREHTGDLHNVKGHGLGLAYVKRIVEDHQGIVYAESEKGKGSTFYVKVPVIY